MKKLLAFLVSLITFLPAMAAENIQVKGNLASYYSLTQVGCIATNRFLLASDETLKVNGGDNNSRRLLFITEYDFDTCNGIDVRQSSGSMQLEKNQFSISTGGARLMATVQMTGTFGIEMRNVDLTWAPTQKLWNGSYTTKYSGPGLTVITRYNGSSQEALVTGSLSAEAVNVLGGLDVVKTGTVTITEQ